MGERQDPAPARGPVVRVRGLRTFRGKIIASTVGVMALAMLLVGLGLQLVLEVTAQHDVDRVLRDRAAAMITVVDQASEGAAGRITVPADVLEPGVEVYAADGTRLAGSMERDARATARRLGSEGRARTVTVSDDETRLLAEPFTTSGGLSGVVVVSAETSPYERSELYALIATGVLGVLVVVASGLIAWRVTRQALRPVRLMAERADDWSEHDLDQRFDLGPPTDELSALAAVLDRLLDRVASVILAEQRLTAELAHELRTPLTSIRGAADLALLRGVDDPALRREIEQVSASATAMSGVISTLLDISRDGAASTVHRTTTAAELLAEAAARAPSRDGVDVRVRTGGSVARIAAPPEVAVRALQPVVDNAVHHARSVVVLEAVDHPDRVDLVATDDGLGIEPALAERLFDPGVSHRDGGAGLGLGIARRVARSLGGDVTLADPPAGGPGGARFVVCLPRR